jgi:hypothetical protein
MGQISSLLSDLRKSEELVDDTCICCYRKDKKHNKATYRCQLEVSDIFTFRYRETSTEEEIRKAFSMLSPESIDALVLLKKYHYSSYGMSSESAIQFAACDNCIANTDKKYFTHFPDGWGTNPKMHISFEPIKLT